MKEEFLHYVWQFQLLNTVDLTTTQGEKIQVLKVGEKNTNAGPDFFNGKIKIGKTTWVGNIEIHINSSDWKNHKHQRNPAYDNVILHVVFKHNVEVLTTKNRTIPTLELANLIDKKIDDKYKTLVDEKRKIPCQNLLSSIDDFTIKNWQDRLVVERLETKSKLVLESLQETNNDWEQTFYRLLAKNFGFKINALPFELTAKSLSLKTLKKHKNSLLQVEALLFGQAGFLEENFNETYPIKLQKEYQFLQSKFQIQPIQKHQWKLLRLRPSNFPAIRLAQFSQLIYQTENLFSVVMEAKSTQEVEKIFSIELQEYWHNHYQLDVLSVHKKKKLGRASISLLLINTVIPFLFAYGKRKNKPEQVEKAMQFLHEIKSEKNAIITTWQNLGIKIHTAFQSQAMLQLKNEYCANIKCLNCAIGNKIIRS